MRRFEHDSPSSPNTAVCSSLAQPSLTRENDSNVPRVLFIVSLAVVLTIAHFSTADGAHLRAVHIILAGMYVVPILAAALWFHVLGGIVTALAISLAYFIHIRVSWPHQPVANENQMAMIAIYWVFAGSSGVLVWLQERERLRRRLAEECSERDAVIQGICGLLNALRARDEYTQKHSERVAAVAVEIGKRRGLPADRIHLLRLAALVHDIGKIGIRDDVLLKPEELNEEERTRIQRHPIVAADILRPIHGTKEIADIVLAHHECPDGSGYPCGLRREQILTESHIIRAADVFCSLTESRPYKDALATETVMQVMQRMAGTKLDAESVRVLEEITVVKGGDGLAAQRRAA